MLFGKSRIEKKLDALIEEGKRGASAGSPFSHDGSPREVKYIVARSDGSSEPLPLASVLTDILRKQDELEAELAKLRAERTWFAALDIEPAKFEQLLADLRKPRGGILPMQLIRERCKYGEPLISPFYERSISRGMSYGLGPSGYDVRIAEDIELHPQPIIGRFANVFNRLLFGKEKVYVFSLASTMEHFNMPNDLVGKVMDKSTWARRGLTLQTTIIEAGWKGYLTLELTNHSWKKITLKRGMPIAQIIFELLVEPTESAYSGKYQRQKAGAQPAIFEDVPIGPSILPKTPVDAPMPPYKPAKIAAGCS
jgi:dCTP deaminase